MSTTMGAVWVLPSGAAAGDKLREGLAGWLAGASERADRWDLPGVADASLFVRPDEVGFDLVVVRFSATAYGADPAGVTAWVAAGFDAAKASLGAIFGMMSRYPDHFDAAWLRENVTIPVLMEEWDALRAQPFEAVWAPYAGGAG